MKIKKNMERSKSYDIYKNQKVLWNWHHQLIDNLFIMSTTDTVNYFSYLDLNLAIGSGLIKNEILQWFKFSVVNFPFWYSRACSSYSNFFNGVFLITSKLLNQRFPAFKLKSSLRKCYGYRRDLVNRYGLSVSQITTNMFSLSLWQFRAFFKTWPVTGVITGITR